MIGTETAVDWRLIGSSQGPCAIVDAQDYERLSCFKWQYGQNGYFYRRLPGSKKSSEFSLMHREIMGNPGRKYVDHINRNKLDNRRSNLRICDASQSNSNIGKHKHYHGRCPTSKYKGVYWHKVDGKWCAEIRFRGKKTYLGLYELEEDAAKAYNVAAIEIQGEYALLNEIQP